MGGDGDCGDFVLLSHQVCSGPGTKPGLAVLVTSNSPGVVNCNTLQGDHIEDNTDKYVILT